MDNWLREINVRGPGFRGYEHYPDDSAGFEFGATSFMAYDADLLFKHDNGQAAVILTTQYLSAYMLLSAKNPSGLAAESWVNQSRNAVLKDDLKELLELAATKGCNGSGIISSGGSERYYTELVSEALAPVRQLPIAENTLNPHAVVDIVANARMRQNLLLFSGASVDKVDKGYEKEVYVLIGVDSEIVKLKQELLFGMTPEDAKAAVSIQNKVVRIKRGEDSVQVTYTNGVYVVTGNMFGMLLQTPALSQVRTEYAQALKDAQDMWSPDGPPEQVQALIDQRARERQERVAQAAAEKHDSALREVAHRKRHTSDISIF